MKTKTWPFSGEKTTSGECYSLTVTTKLPQPVNHYHTDAILQRKRGAKDMYNIMTEYKENIASYIRWNRIYDIQTEDWKNIYELPFCITKCAQLQWFQFRITCNHKILAINAFLRKLNASDTSL